MTSSKETRRPVEADCHLPESPQCVWEALASPDRIAKWLLPLARDGAGTADFALDGSGCGLAARIECTVLESDPPRFLRLSWLERSADGERASEVMFHLDLTAAGGTHLRVVHALPATRTPRAAANCNSINMSARAA